MQTWQMYKNYRKQQTEDGSYTYIITVDGVDVEVSEDIYVAYAIGGRKMKYMECDLKNDRVLQDSSGRAVRSAEGDTAMQQKRETSLDKLINDDWDFPSSDELPEDTVIKQVEIEALYACLDALNTKEREMIVALFFDGLTEREYAKSLGISKTALHARKVKVLDRIKNYLNS